MKWVYVRDYPSTEALYEVCAEWYAKGYRVFIQGYSAMDCVEYKP